MKQSIKNKLIIGFSIILTLLIIVSFLMTSKLAESNNRLESIVDISSKNISLSKQVLIHVLNAARQEKNMILTNDLNKKKFYLDKMNETISLIDKKIPELKESVTNQGKEDLNEFKTIWNNYKISVDQMVPLAMQNENEKAFEISSIKAYKTREDIIEIMERIISRNEDKMIEDKRKNGKAYQSSLSLITGIIITGIILSLLIAFWIIQSITKRILSISNEAEKIASREFTNDKIEDRINDELKPIFNSLININESFKEITENANSVALGSYTIKITPRSEKDVLGHALKKMTHSLRDTTAENEKHNWLTSGQNQLNDKLIGDKSIEELSNKTINFLCNYLEANIGAMYLFNDKNNTLELSAQYAFSSPENIKANFLLHEGIIGQVAKEQKIISLTNITEEHVHVTSSIINAKPKQLLVAPFMFEGKTVGVIEIGRLSDFNETEKEFINNSMDSIAISINSALSRNKIQELLEETQVQSEELQSQQEELKQMNEELEEQSQNLKQQQEELQMTNEELEEQTQSLEMKNKEVETAKRGLEQKSKQLEISSKYKSEFLSNMSHELRTPLNSLLILSKDLSENKKKNLTIDQVECAEIIYKSGNDLLVLINEVLDLSKIEAGKMSLNIEKVFLQNIVDGLFQDFKRSVEQKGLKLTSSLDKGTPKFIRTDSQRLNQILKKFLVKCFKIY